MRAVFKKLASAFVRNDTLWRATKNTLVDAVHYMDRERRRVEHQRGVRPEQQLRTEAIRRVCPDLTVRNGVFKGLRYPSAQSVGSELFPKLLGSYEREIQPLVETLCATPYSDVVNVGCAEGYYAVGLAMRLPKATVYAFDIDPRAVRLCREMASLNHVDDRLVTASSCDADRLRAIPLGPRALVVCDCEGYERELLTDGTARALRNHDFLVEVHDWIDIGISSDIRRSFQSTHDILITESVDDIVKAKTYDYEELAPYDLRSRLALIGEHRPTIMEWMFLRSRRLPAPG